jgi:TonB family protein
MFKDKRLDLGILISFIIHILIFFLFYRSGSASAGSYEDINEVTFLDQSYRPEVAKVVPKGSVWGEMNEMPSAASATSEQEIVTPAIDLSAKLDRSQAKIDLDRYVSEDNMGDVVKIGNRDNGTMKSTDEILAEKPISLAKNLPRGAGSEGGVGIGGPGGIGIKADVQTIKIDKRPPPPTTTSIGKQVEKQVEQKLKVETGSGTQISLAGPIASRGILKKLLPNYPSWCLSQGISGVVKIKIWVEPSGKVREGALIECSSGYPDLDQAVVNALKAWLFAPLPGTVVQESQWGVITFRFVCG